MRVGSPRASLDRSSGWLVRRVLFLVLPVRISWLFLPPEIRDASGNSHYILCDDGQLVESRWSGPALDVLWWVVGGQGRRGGRSEVKEIEGD